MFRVAAGKSWSRPSDGDWLLSAGCVGRRAGELVVATDPREPERFLVKRVRSVAPDGVTIQGDHADPAESTDSRQFGPIPGSAVVGRPVLRYAPIGRIGLVR